jgi:hypothetical protein
LWLEAYAKLSAIKVAEVTQKAAYRATITCTPHMTLISSAFASQSRVRLAHELELNITLERYRFAAGSHADVDTLVAAHELGMQYTSSTLFGAARAGAAYKLVWLYAMCGPQHVLTTNMIACEAAKAGSITALGITRWGGSTAHSRGLCLAAAPYYAIVYKYAVEQVVVVFYVYFFRLSLYQHTPPSQLQLLLAVTLRTSIEKSIQEQ